MPKNWPQLIDAMDARWMDEDERFADSRARLRNDDELSAQLFLWTTSVTKREAYERAGRCRAPISPVNDMGDLLVSGHLRERGFFRTVEHPVAGAMDYAGPPSRMPASPPELRPAPMLGQHNAEVYGELLGLSPRQIALLSAAGVV
jgi:crotonobetainyl-CoA:carnitine CoA-transferase CaiB-like acyl-CoA transferase